MKARTPLLGGEPGKRGERIEAHVAAGDNERVRDSFEAPELHREIVHPLGVPLPLRPRRGAAAGDEVPELEVFAREVVGVLAQLDVIAAAREAQHRDLERAETPERCQEIGAQTACLSACGVRALAPDDAADRLSLGAQHAVAIDEWRAVPFAEG